MNPLDDVLQRAMSSVPDCIATALVDLGSGMMLGIRTVDSHPAGVIDMLAAATADLFQGPNVQAIEKTFRRARGLGDDAAHHYFQEIIVNSDNLIHVFVRGSRQQQVACFVCRKCANLGMVLTKARQLAPELEAAL